MDKTWEEYYRKNKVRDRKKRFKRRFGINTTLNNVKYYANMEMLSARQLNILIYDLIKNETPSMIARFGGTELSAMTAFFEYDHGVKNVDLYKKMEDMKTGPGFFSNDLESGRKFVELMVQCCKDVDVLGVWDLFMEDYFINVYMKDVHITALGNLEPWNCSSGSEKEKIIPWSKALEGKKVLFVHPFEKSMRRQYEERRELIWSNAYKPDEILPRFDMRFVKAIQSLDEQNNVGFTNWFEALDVMIDRCRKEEFDVAIIGCGAYGFPLASEIKKMGKVAIHLGGATQLMFGIKGKRWDKMPQINRFYNAYWIRPDDSERIKDCQKVEGGCYW